MDKGFTVPKWVGADSLAENTPKCICPSPKVWDFNEKRIHWASLVRDRNQKITSISRELKSEKFLIILETIKLVK